MLTSCPEIKTRWLLAPNTKLLKNKQTNKKTERKYLWPPIVKRVLRYTTKCLVHLKHRFQPTHVLSEGFCGKKEAEPTFLFVAFGFPLHFLVDCCLLFQLLATLLLILRSSLYSWDNFLWVLCAPSTHLVSGPPSPPSFFPPSSFPPSLPPLCLPSLWSSLLVFRIIYLMCVFYLHYVCVPCVYLVPTAVRRGCWIP